MMANTAMRRLLRLIDVSLRNLPDRDNQEYLIEGGWTRSANGAVLLTELVPAGGGSSEYEVNDVAVRPVVDGEVVAETRAVRSLETGLSFATRVVRAARDLPEFASMVAMVSVSVDYEDEDFDEQPATLRFFSEANTPGWLEDLDAYELEAIGLWTFPEVAANEARQTE